jgi:hypothetical protein
MCRDRPEQLKLKTNQQYKKVGRPAFRLSVVSSRSLFSFYAVQRKIKSESLAVVFFFVLHQISGSFHLFLFVRAPSAVWIPGKKQHAA